jgi:hypothetical protein
MATALLEDFAINRALPLSSKMKAALLWVAL